MWEKNVKDQIEKIKYSLKENSKQIVDKTKILIIFFCIENLLAKAF